MGLGATPPPRPPPRTNKLATSKIPTKLGHAVEEAAHERPVKEVARVLVDLEEASNVSSDSGEVKKIPVPAIEKVNYNI